MLGLYAKRNMKGACSIVCKAPWHVILFAIGMYMLVYSLKNIGLIEVLGNIFDTLGVENLFGYMGVTVVLVTVMSNLMNNLPSVMIGTIMLLNLHLPPEYLQLSYLASIIGGDIGSLLLPMGTLASLLWIHIVSKELSISWKDYMRVSFVVIPISICISLLALFGWGVLILG